jgi:hypothetical protein
MAWHKTKLQKLLAGKFVPGGLLCQKIMTILFLGKCCVHYKVMRLFISILCRPNHYALSLDLSLIEGPL